MTVTRRSLLLGATAAFTLGTAARAATPTGPQLLHITRDPSCGCCTAWADLAREAGYMVEITETDDYAGMKAEAGVPEPLWACHTARVGGYIVEGHVPFAAIARLLAERPDITGIAVPGMPLDSPGMGGGLHATADVVAWGGLAGDATPFAF
ncbi:DUF411 domain-containing protein [Oceanicola granulosus]|nr:DUF411 domain-containing protein [Oceanicola granulosus]